MKDLDFELEVDREGSRWRTAMWAAGLTFRITDQKGFETYVIETARAEFDHTPRDPLDVYQFVVAQAMRWSYHEDRLFGRWIH